MYRRIKSFLLALVIGLVCRDSVAFGETRSWLFASLLQDRTILSYERNPVTGELTKRASTVCPAEPAFMCLAPNGKTLFVSLRSSGQLASFRISASDGNLTLVSVTEGGEDPAYLLTDRNARFLLTAYYVANKVTIHAIGDDGSLGKDPLQTVLTSEKAHGIGLDSANRLAFVPHTGANRIYQFYFDAGKGRLTASDPPFVEALPDEHPRHIAIHPSDRWAYSNGEAGDSLSAYAIDGKRATLKRFQTLSTIPQDFDGSLNATARCEMTRDGRFVYVANRGHNSVAGFAVDQETGRLTSLGQTPTEKTPRSLTIEPQGRFLYAAGQDSGKIAAYRIHASGSLERLATYEAGPVAWCVLSADVPLP